MPAKRHDSKRGAIPVAVAARRPLTQAEVEGTPDQWGRFDRPTPWALDTLDWLAEGFEPRWLGHDTSDCAASFDPCVLANQGADEEKRFTQGVRGRPDLAIVIWTAGRNDDVDAGSRNVFGNGDSTLTPFHGHLSAKLLPLGVEPILADDLTPGDRDLAMRLRNDPGIACWWALKLEGLQVPVPFQHRYDYVTETDFKPLLQDTTGATLAGVIEVDGQRWYVIPRGASQTGILRWLMQHALPAWAPNALRKARRAVDVDAKLQTPAELSLRAKLAELDDNYGTERERLASELAAATEDADPIREGLLYGRGDDLEDAVASAFRQAGLKVQSLDDLLGDTTSADLLVDHDGKRWLVEVKSANGAASESLVADLDRHLKTWPELKSDLPADGGMLVVNHQLSRTPTDRPAAIYTREEFVDSLASPVIAARTIFDIWREQDWSAMCELFS